MAHKGNGQVLEKSVTVCSRSGRIPKIPYIVNCIIREYNLQRLPVSFLTIVSFLACAQQVVEQNAGLLTDFEVLQMLRRGALRVL